MNVGSKYQILDHTTIEALYNFKQQLFDLEAWVMHELTLLSAEIQVLLRRIGAARIDSRYLVIEL